jgi:hypothetical protein
MSSLSSSVIDYKTLVQDDRIHASLYTDPRIFDDEMERIFRRGWVFIGHDSEVPGAGDFVTRRMGTEPVIMVRGTTARSPCSSTAACTGAPWCVRPIAGTHGR